MDCVIPWPTSEKPWRHRDMETVHYTKTHTVCVKSNIVLICTAHKWKDRHTEINAAQPWSALEDRLLMAQLLYINELHFNITTVLLWGQSFLHCSCLFIWPQISYYYYFFHEAVSLLIYVIIWGKVRETDESFYMKENGNVFRHCHLMDKPWNTERYVNSLDIL